MTDGLGGQRVVRFKRSQLLCAPAIRGPATSVSSTTTTTTPPGPCDFNSSDRKCEGTCGNGGHCSAVASGGACECRTTACGDASSPSCDGFCTPDAARSEEHTSELQSRPHLVCRLLLEKKKALRHQITECVAR